jgi:hypothetical protein
MSVMSSAMDMTCVGLTSLKSHARLEPIATRYAQQLIRNELQYKSRCIRRVLAPSLQAAAAQCRAHFALIRLCRIVLIVPEE